MGYESPHNHVAAVPQLWIDFGNLHALARTRSSVHDASGRMDPLACRGDRSVWCTEEFAFLSLQSAGAGSAALILQPAVAASQFYEVCSSFLLRQSSQIP